MEPLERSDPTRIGGITLRGRLGSGGMGRVYYGVTDDGEQVAVKLIREDLLGHPEARARFAREIDALRAVQGPHIAALVDASREYEERPWLAVAYVRGLSLKEFVETRGPLPGEHVATLGVLLASALSDIHAAGLYHRDLKPANILLGKEGAKVIDLGLAAFSTGPTDLTRTEAALGTPACMSPEQAGTPKQVTAATDVHALGATLTFASAGHYPYHGTTVAALFMNIVNPEVKPDLSGVPAEFAPLIAAMLAHNPDDRPTVREVHERLKEAATAGGITLPVAVRRFAAATYVERDTDPKPVAPPRPRPRDLSEVVVPGSVVAKLADRLRAAYAAGARF